jgi:hypothetical protein
MRAIYRRRSVWWMTLTLLAIVGMAAIGGACDGLPTLRQAHRSEAVADKGIPPTTICSFRTCRRRSPRATSG